MSEHTKKQYENCTIEKQDGSQVRIVAEVPLEVVREHRAKAIKHIIADFEIPGFRKGHVPEEMVLEKIGEQGVMEEIADRVLGGAYADIVEDNNLDVVGRPQVSVTKLAPENPICFTITVAVYPELTLPDYKKLSEDARKKADDPEKVTVSDEDVQKELERLHGMVVEGEKNMAKKQKEAKENEEGGEKKEETEEVQETPLDDAFAQKMGDFATLDVLKAKIKEGMEIEKKQKAYEKKRLAIVDAVLEKVKVELPAIFVEGELDQMFAEFRERVSRAGMTVEDYLEQIKKTAEDLRKEWKGDAERRATLQLVLAEIAKKEKIEVDAERLEREVKHVKEHYPEADEANIRMYVAGNMRNEAVFAFLEGNSAKKEEEK